MILISSAIFYKMDELYKEAIDIDINASKGDIKNLAKAGIAAMAAKALLEKRRVDALPKAQRLSSDEVLAKKTEKMADKIVIKFDKKGVTFLYPRVLSNIEVAKIPVSKMNATLLSFYRKKDKQFFKNWFKSQSFKEVFLKIASDEEDEMEKTAISKNSASTMFLRSDVSPVCYFKAMLKKYRTSFLQLDAEVLLKKIEIDFSLDPFPINDIALGKIFWIQNINSNSKTFESPFAFEKLIRSFNEKPFDFFVSQHEDITPTEIACTLSIANEVAPNMNVYRVINQDVIKFLAERLYDKGCQMFWPLEVSNGDGQLDLYRAINTEIARLVINEDSSEENKLNTSEKLKEVLTKAKDLYSAYRKGDMSMDLLQSNIKALEAQNIYLGKQVMFQVYLNIGIDAYIKDAKTTTEEQLAMYALT